MISSWYHFGPFRVCCIGNVVCTRQTNRRWKSLRGRFFTPHDQNYGINARNQRTKRDKKAPCLLSSCSSSSVRNEVWRKPHSKRPTEVAYAGRLIESASPCKPSGEPRRAVRSR